MGAGTGIPVDLGRLHRSHARFQPGRCVPVPTPVEQGGIVDNEVRGTDIVVIGAGQAGLSSGYYLRRHGIEPGSGFGSPPATG